MTSTPTDGPDRTDDREAVAKVAGLVRDARIAMLTTTSDDGRLVSRPMAVQEVEFDGDLWFIAAREQRKVPQIQADPRVNVSFSSGSTWVSVDGDAALVSDLERTKQLWNPVVEAWFPDGPESPEVVLVRVHAHAAEYWDTPGGRIASVISFAKAKITGQPYSGGDNEVVDLDR